MGNITFNSLRLSLVILSFADNSHGTNRHDSNKPIQSVCPNNMSSVAILCGGKFRQIEIQSVELMPYLSFCEKPTLDNSCTELIYQKVETSCNGNKKCKQLIWNQSVSTWDDCIRIPQKKSTDDKHNIAINRNDNNADYIENQNTAMPANYNSEMSNFELRNYNHKGTNEGKTVNHQESNSETRINGQIIRQYSNLATFSTALEPLSLGVLYSI
ncbi:unnamed protein product [Mytilus edulis]|uniref:SUEL-type lectin domain-containing protein n=1 Tax=Mytilus edulis TaxID=6550 RepID=A0A8S3V5R5_MYTED|nr:unnamed protein product [Mytilus edulis]